VLLAVPFGLAIGLSVGMLGGGGAVLSIPVLVYVLGQDVHAATTASLVVVAAASLAGGLGQARERRVCWKHARAFAPPALLGVGLGTVANQAVDGELLLVLFAPVMLVAAWATWRRPAPGSQPEVDPARACPPVDLVRDVSLGMGVGLLTGFFGVGGGFVVVPALAVALAMPLRLAIGTSLVVVTLVSVAGLGAHLAAGNEFDAGPALALALACVAGALAGPSLAARVPERLLGNAFAALLAAVAVYLLAASAFLGGPPNA
jgi:hypothetical protein